MMSKITELGVLSITEDGGLDMRFYPDLIW